jgi:UDP-N-acetylglucosamine:LPS N-acetylglucosamine transferase
MGHKLSPLLGDKARLLQLKSNARRLGKPRAAFDVAKLALEM